MRSSPGDRELAGGMQRAQVVGRVRVGEAELAGHLGRAQLGAREQREDLQPHGWASARSSLTRSSSVMCAPTPQQFLGSLRAARLTVKQLLGGSAVGWGAE